MKATLDFMISELKASSSRSKTLSIASKDGMGYEIEIEGDNIVTNLAGIILKGKEMTVKSKKNTKKVKTTIFLPWSELSKAEGMESTAPPEMEAEPKKEEHVE